MAAIVWALELRAARHRNSWQQDLALPQGDAVQQLEQEVKLDPSPGWSLPDLTGVLPGVHAQALPDVALETTYYDTADLRLARHNMTLRFRRETEAVPRVRGSDQPPTTEVWTVKLPSSSDSTALTRTEVTWPGEGGSSSLPGAKRAQRRPRATGRGLQDRNYEFEKVHPEAAHFVQAATLGHPLEPVAHLSSTRHRTELRTSDGRRLAEIDQDTITGRDLLASQERLPGEHGTPPDVRFSEVEVELAEGSAIEVLDAVVKRLEETGARRSTSKSKLATVLTSPTSVDSYRAQAPIRTGAARTGGDQAIAMSAVLQEQARSCLDVLVDHDPAIRLDDPDPEHVHRSRVAVRRLRTVLREFATFVSAGQARETGPADGAGPSQLNSPPEAGPAEAWFAMLGHELKWLGGSLGTVRDSDVRVQSLAAHCAALPETDASAAAFLLATATDQQRDRHVELREVIETGRYMELLRALDAIASGPASTTLVPPELWDLLSGPAAAGMPSLAHRQWRALRTAVGRLGDQPADPALHRVRIQAKRFRYLAEVAAPVIEPATNRRAAGRAVKAATALQDVLGDLHDAVVTEQWLRDVALLSTALAEPADLIATGVAAGQLIALERERQRARRASWLAVWERLDHKELRTWAYGEK